MILTDLAMNPLLHKADRLLVVLSDIEMGAGGPYDDFPHSDRLAELIASYCEPPFNEMNVELVFNGDTFDLLKTAYLETYPRHMTRDVALGKMARVSAAHPRFFEGLRYFLQSGSSSSHGHAKGTRRVTFTVGNHDPELIFDEVQQFVRSLCGGSSEVYFPGLTYDVGRVRIEHGAQYDPIFRMDPDALLVRFNNDEVLNISWGAVALLDAVIPLQPLLHFHDRLRPKKELFRLMPELKELMHDVFWQYWTRDYWHGYFNRSDPTKKVSWSMVKELAWRWGFREPDVALEGTPQQQLVASDARRLYVVGHQHQAGSWSYGNRKFLQSGCLRNEYMLANEGKKLEPIVKSFIEVYMRGDEPIVSQLLEFEGPPAPPGHIPESIFDVLGAVREIIAKNRSTETHAAQREQEERERQSKN
ncbi:MAG: hypothetical protein R3C68_01290 [Myxococcota bacterium]